MCGPTFGRSHMISVFCNRTTGDAGPHMGFYHIPSAFASQISTVASQTRPVARDPAAAQKAP